MAELRVSDLRNLCLKSLDAIIKQGVRSVRTLSGGPRECLYRGPNGTKCAIGHIIKDEHYSSELEGKHLYHIYVLDALSASVCARLTYEDSIVLLRLQEAHDSLEKEDWTELYEGLRQHHPNTKEELGNYFFSKLDAMDKLRAMPECAE